MHYLKMFRIYKGVAKYTSDFVVPSPSPDILPDTPSGVSGGSKLTKITDGAVSFDGSGDYYKCCSSSDLDFGTGDFTFEAFINTDGTGTRGYKFLHLGWNNLSMEISIGFRFMIVN